MKSVPVIALLIIAIVVATILHAKKNSRETDDIDEAAIGLKGIERVLSPETRVLIRQYDVPGELWLYCRYVLTPRNSLLYRPDINKGWSTDTIISITSLFPPDSVIHNVNDNRKLLWQHTTAKYKYYLTCNNR